MTQIKTIVVLGLIAILLAACAPGPNTLAVEYHEQRPEEPAGFWFGLWHGVTSPITFIISLFTDNVNIYEVRNNGGWYNFGFVLGASIIFGGSGGGAGSRKRRRQTE